MTVIFLGVIQRLCTSEGYLDGLGRSRYDV